ncbi:MAG TPA: RNA polymerase sigma factor region1.1 domain-containing protein, partial [Acidimicrobiales bacterium]|nr:RNA polymerase sigma factor region1.1 domain-containing protein [Acidimicrobiales bacterium]
MESEALEEVLQRGRAQGVLTPEDLVEVVREVELSPEVIDQLVQRVGDEGIAFKSEDHVLEGGDEEASDEVEGKRTRAKAKRSVTSAETDRESSSSTNGTRNRIPGTAKTR